MMEPYRCDTGVLSIDKFNSYNHYLSGIVQTAINFFNQDIFHPSYYYKFGKIILYFKSFFIVSRGFSLLKKLSKHENIYYSEFTQQDIITIKNLFEDLVINLNDLIESQKKANFSKLLLKTEDELLDEFENKLENYQIALEPNIKYLLDEIDKQI
jgi:hypothetical protein